MKSLYKSLLPILSLFMVCFYLVACSDILKLSSKIDESIYIISQKGKKVELDIYDFQTNRPLGSLKLQNTSFSQPLPALVLYLQGKQLLFALMHPNEDYNELYLYDSEQGKVTSIGQIPSTIYNVLVIEEQLYTVRSLVNNDKQGYFLDIYHFPTLEKVKSIELNGAPSAPIKMLYAEDQQALYILFSGGVPATVLGRYSLPDGNFKVNEVDSHSLAGDFLIIDGDIYVSLQGYSDERNTIFTDNRIVVYDQNLQKERTLTTSISPHLITSLHDHLYIVSSGEKTVLEIYSLKQNKTLYLIPLTNSYIDHNAITDIKAMNNQIFILAGNRMLKINQEKEISAIDLKGDTLTRWGEREDGTIEY